MSGVVTDATSRGVLPNIVIAVDSGATAGLSTRTDASGAYALSGVSSEAAFLRSSAVGYFTGSTTVPAGGDVRVNIVMTRTSGPTPTPGPTLRPVDPTPPPGGAVITFGSGVGLVSSYFEAGFTVVATNFPWLVNGAHGAPEPSFQFQTPAGITTDGEIDGLLIRLTNAAAPCCANPMGVDNIILTR